jgi:hypothetical protein
MLSAKKAGQRTLIVSGGDRILSDIEKLWIFTIVKMRFGMFEVKYQPSVLWGPIPFQRAVISGDQTISNNRSWDVAQLVTPQMSREREGRKLRRIVVALVGLGFYESVFVSFS